MLFIMNTWKILQRRTYDILSNKYSLLIILLAFTTIFVSVIQFGEVWMIWSQEKYDAMFNSFSDNVIGKSLQHKLCQTLPIDVVYTWVNGSDPLLLEQLQSYRQKLQEETSARCPYQHCVPSHFAAFREWVSTTSSQPSWKRIHVLNGGPNQPMSNWTLVDFTTIEEAMEATHHKLDVGSVNATLHLAHWTTDKDGPNIYRVYNAVIISGFPPAFLIEAERLIKARLIRELNIEVKRLWVHEPKGILIVELESPDAASSLLKMYHGNATLYRLPVNIHQAFLIMQLPIVEDPKDYSPSRFEDKEELRYSLRSLEKFAPWVRHVYLVTNGQIPYWLNLDNPRLTIITHQEIFPNASHLPTFSSPAIESHLHRIPGLSQKFLYLNDDVMFGREVWPDDFITHANGQKIYFSWSVPDCSDSCPWSWIGDGSCDVSCNTSDCSFDGGDCDPGNEDAIGNGGAFYDDNHHHNFDSINEDFALGEERNLFDVSRQHGHGQAEEGQVNETQQERELLLRQLETLGVDTFQDGDVVYQHNKPSDVGKSQDTNNHERAGEVVPSVHINITSVTHLPEAKTWTAKDDYRVATSPSAVVTSATSVHFPAYQGIDTIRNDKNAYNSVLRGRKLKVYENGNSNTPVETRYSEVRTNNELLGANLNGLSVLPLKKIFASQSAKRPKRQNVNKMKSKSKRYLELLQKRRENGTAARFLASKSRVAVKKRDIWDTEDSRSVGLFEEEVQKNESANVAKSKKSQSYDLQYKPSSVRKPRDTFAESLLYVNRLFNQEFGFEVRKVPAHMPHLIDKKVMQELQKRFSKQWDLTSSHKIRSPQDMQFAFSYFYFLMSEKYIRPLEEVFDTFDTDLSGTWSDREIRTLLTRAYELPLSYHRVIQFEEEVCNCSRNSPSMSVVATPPYERYQDSKLPVVSKELILNCEPISSILKEKFAQSRKYKTEVVKEKYQDVTFKMLNSNLSQLITLLDDVRKEPKKFICLNDNLDPSREKDNVIARAVLQDFYEALFPLPSSFELPAEYRNRFLHLSELQEWRTSRGMLRNAVYVCLALLIIFTVLNFFQVECRVFQRRHQFPVRHRCQEV
ncbi:N-acetylglucosamine-1-phosphotransferase subunits alpha/beta [Anabrus simplex]|uniref:N-acetylglucosamine-1-phosphotransferase subunits alpha/beta n=1 Tax=Anabrus simplex TaxID=316456 RepID=UPI0035A29530